MINDGDHFLHFKWHGPKFQSTNKGPQTITLHRNKNNKINIICVEYVSVNSMLKNIFNHFHSFSPQCMWEKCENIKGPIKIMYPVSWCNYYFYFGLLFIGFAQIHSDILFSTRKVVNVCLYDRQTSWKSAKNNGFKPQRFHNNDALTNITRSKPDSP